MYTASDMAACRMRCIPVGQRLAVPRNCFASMVQTGAKGSKVNQPGAEDTHLDAVILDIHTIFTLNALKIILCM